jgi:hypothetical protein
MRGSEISAIVLIVIFAILYIINITFHVSLLISLSSSTSGTSYLSNTNIYTAFRYVIISLVLLCFVPFFALVLLVLIRESNYPNMNRRIKSIPNSFLLSIIIVSIISGILLLLASVEISQSSLLSQLKGSYILSLVLCILSFILPSFIVLYNIFLTYH